MGKGKKKKKKINYAKIAEQQLDAASAKRLAGDNPDEPVHR